MSTLAIIYASKGKSTNEIADSILYFANSLSFDSNSLNIYNCSDKTYKQALELIKKSDYLAFGSPTYDNGKPLPDMCKLFNDLTKDNVSGKKTMLFGAYEWGRCESVDYLLSRCEEKSLDVFENGTIEGLIGLRLNTVQIKDDDKIFKYLTAFLSKKTDFPIYDDLYLSCSTDNKISSLATYRKKINAEKIENIEFNNCKFIRADFSGQFFSNVVFRNCIFWYSKFDNSTLNTISFDSCDLTDCSFRSVSFERTIISSSDMSESDFYDSDLLDLKLYDVTMKKVTFDRFSTLKFSPEYLIDKHEKNKNYYAAGQIQSKLYLNSKKTDNYELAQMFYYRKMENLRRLSFKQSLFYKAYLLIISMRLGLLKLLKIQKASKELESLYSSKSTQQIQGGSIRNTVQYILLVVLKLLTGYSTSVIRLLGMTSLFVFVSAVLLAFSLKGSDLFQNYNLLEKLCQCLNYALYGMFGIGFGMDQSCMVGILSKIIYYFDGFWGITIEAVFAYILIEKMNR